MKLNDEFQSIASLLLHQTQLYFRTDFLQDASDTMNSVSWKKKDCLIYGCLWYPYG